MTRIVGTLVLLVTLLPVPLATRAAAAAPAAQARTKIDPAVLETVEATGFAEFWVVFDTHANLQGAAAIADWDKRGAYVVKRLQATAERSQTQLRQILAKHTVPFQSYWIANAIHVQRADQQLLLDTAARADVVKIVAQEIRPLPPVTPSEQPRDFSVAAVEWGVNSIKAPHVWSTYNNRGEGIVVANIDSGVQFDHPALVCGSPSVAPCDKNGHGTHTMGTMVGDDGAGNQIGVAPAARWIAAKGCEDNGCSLSSLLAAGQWLLAPTDIRGRNPRADLRPHIVNNSWADGAGSNTFYSTIVNAWIASGIFPVFAAGNTGPACQTVSSPGDYADAYAVGAYNFLDAIARYSSRGSSRLTNGIKPNIAAPGTDVFSAYPDNEYAGLNGTSMAAPHVAGSVALLWSGSSALLGNVSATRAILDQSAIDVNDTSCGGTAANNNVWGQGKLDVYAAVTRSTRDQKATISGTLTDQATGAGVLGLTVTAVGPAPKKTNLMATTNASGAYNLRLPAGTWRLYMSGYGYHSHTIPSVTVAAGGTLTQNVALVSQPRYTISGTVRNTFGAPLPGVSVALNAPIAAVTTDANGNYTIKGVTPDTYVLRAKLGRCNESRSQNVTVTGATTTHVSLPQTLDAYGYACQATAFNFVPGTTRLALSGDENAAQVYLPFPFRLYGTSYSTAYVSTNGFLTFAGPQVANWNWYLPDAAEPHAAIYPFWDDLIVDGSAGVYTGVTGTAPNRQVVIEWRNVAFVGGTTERVTFEALLHENGSMTFQYKEISANVLEQGDSATVGIENADSTVAFEYLNNKPILANNQAIRFYPQLVNLLQNGSFELDADLDGVIDSWSPNGNVWREFFEVRSGDWSAVHTSDQNVSYAVSQTVGGIAAGQKYTLVGWVNIPPTSDSFSLKLRVQWRSASDAIISAQTLKQYTAATSGWDEAVATGFVAPAGAAKAHIVMEVNSLNGAIYVDHFAVGK